MISVKVPNNQPGNKNQFHFDHVFGEESNQKKVYDIAARPIIDAVLEGFNGAVLAYGQTNSGKTHTMQGPDITDAQE